MNTQSEQLLENNLVAQLQQLGYEKKQAFTVFSETEKLDPTKLESVNGDYLFTDRTPLRDDAVGVC